MSFESSVRFKEPSPWSDALESFLQKQIVAAAEFETWLKEIDLAAAAGILPDLERAREAAYDSAFTMVREANAQLMQQVEMYVGRAVDGSLSVADFVADVDDFYKSMGLKTQDGWYMDLVFNNAVNRAYQDGLDAVSHTTDSNGVKTAKSWVWGYEWVHGDPERPRPTHLAMNHHRAPASDPVWLTFGPPPIAHNCQCSRHTIGRTDAEDQGLDRRRDFDPPTVTRGDLIAAGITDSAKLKEWSGRSVIELQNQIPGDYFPRSQYDIPNRALINPSGLEGTPLPVDDPVRSSIIHWRAEYERLKRERERERK